MDVISGYQFYVVITNVRKSLIKFLWTSCLHFEILKRKYSPCWEVIIVLNMNLLLHGL